ncbi:MAG: sensor histidine kinase [Actinomycetota bacterium]
MMRSLRSRMVALAATSIVIVIAGVIGGGIVMLKPHELIALAIVASIAAIVATTAANILAGRISRAVTNVRQAAGRLAEGDLQTRVPLEGPEELRAVASAFNEMADGLTRLFSTRRNLVAWASHDLRAPLASLQAMIEALEDGLASPDQYLPIMSAQVETLSKLVDDLFELSRIETGTLALAISDVSVNRVAAECVESLLPIATQQGISLKFADAHQESVARADAVKLDRVLRNLIVNALRYTPTDGSVFVEVSQTPASVQVNVQDTGPGIPDGSMDQVFESFWRGDGSRSSETGGAGLGLAIARGIVQAHGGEIWAENSRTGGAIFAFTLPKA